MRKTIAASLILVTLIAAPRPSLHAAGARTVDDVATQKKINEEQPPLSKMVAHLEDQSRIAGFSKDELRLSPPELKLIRSVEAPNTTEAAAAQAAPGGSPSAPAPRHHLVRTIVIVLTICFAFALVAAVASKK